MGIYYIFFILYPSPYYYSCNLFISLINKSVIILFENLPYLILVHELKYLYL